MSAHRDLVERKIIDAARKQFLDGGIRSLEMKEFAKGLGIGRSTLYRYFPSRESIAFIVADELLVEMDAQAVSAYAGKTYANGFEEYEAATNAFVQVLLESVNVVRFLDEFDQIFTSAYPEIDSAREYEAGIINRGSSGADAYERGLEDGSIRQEYPLEYADIIRNSILGLAQRILPREEHYIREHNFGREALVKAAEMFLRQIKA